MENPKSFTNIIFIYKFPFPFEHFSLIIKDIQTIGDFMNFIQSEFISEPIFLKGDKIFLKNTFFYFKYKKFISVYFKTENFFETDYYLRIEYKMYKSNPLLFEINFLLNLHYLDENNCLFILEIKLSKQNLNKIKINAIYKECFNNCDLLSNSIKINQINSFYNTNIIINSNYDLVMNICTHINLFKLFIPSIKIFSKLNIYNQENEKSNNEKQYLLMKDSVYNIILKKKHNFFLFPNNIILKVHKFKNSKEQCIIRYKVLKFGKMKNIPIYYIYFLMRKITENHTFISIKLNFFPFIQRSFISTVDNFANQLLNNVRNVCLKYLERKKNKC